MAGCKQVKFIVDWKQIDVEKILRGMTSMTSTLKGGFGAYAKEYEKYSDPQNLFDNWYVLAGQHLWSPLGLGEFDESGYIENTAKNIAKPLKPLVRFYLLKAGQELKPHVDFKTKSCINLVYQKKFASIVVEGKEYPYGQFLLDNTRMHGVRACSEDRFIISFSFDVGYERVYAILEKNGILR